MKRVLLALLILTVPTAALSQSPSLLDNPQLKAAEARIEAADADVAIAVSVRRPQLRASAEIGYLRESLSVPGPAQAGDSISFSGSRDPVRVGVGVEQLLYDGGASRAGVDAARSGHGIAALQAEAVRQDLTRDWTVAILEQRFAASQIEDRQVFQRLATTRLSESTARRNAGLATLTDIDQAKAQSALADAELADARAAFSRANNDVRRLVGTQMAAPNTLPIRSPDASGGPDALLQMALASNPTYLAAVEQERRSTQSVAQAKALRGPRITAVAEAAYARDERFGLQLGEADQLGVFIRGQWLFGAGGANRARIERSAALQDVASFELASLRRTLDDEIRTVLADIEASDLAIQARRQQLDASERVRDGVSIELETGRRTELDLLDADRDVVAAKLALLRAETNSQIFRVRLRRLTGAL